MYDCIINKTAKVNNKPDMKIKIFLAAAIMTAAGTAGVSAQTETTQQEEITMERPTQAELQQQAAGNVGADGQANWYVNMDYAGFEFQLPAGMQIQKGSGFLAKSNDGSFGLSMSNVEKRGSNQKIAYEVCRRLAASMHLPNPQVEKVKYGKCSGAKASGMLEGQHVTVLVLPYDDQEVTTVILATPDHEEWVNHFLQTLKR